MANRLRGDSSVVANTKPSAGPKAAIAGPPSATLRGRLFLVTGN
jgi:hypothetical protein